MIANLHLGFRSASGWIHLRNHEISFNKIEIEFADLDLRDDAPRDFLTVLDSETSDLDSFSEKRRDIVAKSVCYGGENRNCN